jgi:TolA-binding protein
MAKKNQSGLEFIESAEALQNEIVKAEGFFKKNQNLLSYAGGAILLVVLGIVGYNYWNNTKSEEAQIAMFDSVFSFEADSLNQALKGTGGNEGLLAVADEYGSTKAGKLANLYAGIALMKQSKYDEAIERLQNFSSDDYVVQGKAYVLIGDAFSEKKNYAEAITYYKKAVDYNPNKFATPAYIIKLGAAYQANKDNKSAIDAYADLIEKYPTSSESILAKKIKSKLEAEIGG